MYLRENIIIVKREKRMADFLGYSDKLITLSQVLTYKSFYSQSASGRVNLRLFLEMSKGGRIVFLV